MGGKWIAWKLVLVPSNKNKKKTMSSTQNERHTLNLRRNQNVKSLLLHESFGSQDQDFQIKESNKETAKY